MAQQSKLLGRNGVKRIVCVCPYLFVPVFSSFWKGLSLYQACMHWMSSFWRLTGINALLKQCPIPTWHPETLLPTDLVNHKSISQEPCFASRPGGEASVLTHFLRCQNWRANGVMKVMPVSTGEFAGSVIILCRLFSPGPRTMPIMMMTVMKIFFMIPDMFPARVLRVTRDARAVGVCSSSAQCKDDESGWSLASSWSSWGKRQNGCAPWTCRHP